MLCRVEEHMASQASMHSDLAVIKHTLKPHQHCSLISLLDQTGGGYKLSAINTVSLQAAGQACVLPVCTRQSACAQSRTPSPV